MQSTVHNLALPVNGVHNRSNSTELQCIGSLYRVEYSLQMYSAEEREYDVAKEYYVE